jgi:hypothetical protein
MVSNWKHSLEAAEGAGMSSSRNLPNWRALQVNSEGTDRVIIEQTIESLQRLSGSINLSLAANSWCAF